MVALSDPNEPSHFSQSDLSMELVHMARLSPPDRRSTLILLTPDGDGVWYGPGAPLGLRLTFGCRD